MWNIIEALDEVQMSIFSWANARGVDKMFDIEKLSVTRAQFDMCMCFESSFNWDLNFKSVFVRNLFILF